MRLNKLSLALALVALSSTFAQELPDENRSLGDVARETREHNRLKAQDANPQAIHIRELIANMGGNNPAEYAEQMAELLSHHDFDGVEHAADIARSNKSRFPGGPWKLYVFYDAIDWNAHLALLQQWVSRKPQSGTAHIALAQAYLHYGSKARGNGSAGTVTDEGWQSYGGRSQMAFSNLKEAATLPGRCPYWYEAMMHLPDCPNLPAQY